MYQFACPLGAFRAAPLSWSSSISSLAMHHPTWILWCPLFRCTKFVVSTHRSVIKVCIFANASASWLSRAMDTLRAGTRKTRFASGSCKRVQISFHISYNCRGLFMIIHPVASLVQATESVRPEWPKCQYTRSVAKVRAWLPTRLLLTWPIGYYDLFLFPSR